MSAPAVAGQVLLERYLVERILGAGGMGTVVLAVDRQTSQKVAIKLLNPKEDSSAPGTARFVREARAARRLHSEHVAQVYDAGTLPDGTNYIVMEYLEGRDVRSQIAREGPLPVEVAVDIVVQACDAISEAHGL